jgi:hypothetical protein
MKRLLLLLAFTASALGLMCAHAGAITVTFVEPPDSAPSQTIFPAIFVDVGDPVPPTSILSTPGTEMATLSFLVTGGVPPSPALGPFVLLEPGPGPVVVSDIITVEAALVDSAGTRFTMTFQSDPEAGLSLPSNSTQFVETGLSQNVFTGSIVVNPVPVPGPSSLVPLVINITSDLEAVPESTTLLLLGSGLAGVGALRYRRGRVR